MAPAPNQTLSPGDRVGDRYEVVRPLAEGGMGAVYVGRQLGLSRQVAIKTVHPRHLVDPELAQRFRREAQVLQELTHPNTVRLYDFGETPDGLIYLVMEHLKGIPLDVLLAEVGKLPVERVVRVGAQVLKSLVEAHAHGIIHRDIKPSNLFWCEQLGEVDFIKVIDFGLARCDAPREGFATQTGAAMGTPTYMAPEQVRGERADERSDLYSLALTLYELAVGRPLYVGRTPYEVALRHVNAEPLVLPPDLAATTLGRVIGVAASKEPADRYASAAAMLRALMGQEVRSREAERREPGLAPTISHFPQVRAQTTAPDAVAEVVVRVRDGDRPSEAAALLSTRPGPLVPDETPLRMSIKAAASTPLPAVAQPALGQPEELAPLEGRSAPGVGHDAAPGPAPARAAPRRPALRWGAFALLGVVAAVALGASGLFQRESSDAESPGAPAASVGDAPPVEVADAPPASSPTAEDLFSLGDALACPGMACAQRPDRAVLAAPALDAAAAALVQAHTVAEQAASREERVERDRPRSRRRASPEAADPPAPVADPAVEAEPPVEPPAATDSPQDAPTPAEPARMPTNW